MEPWNYINLEITMVFVLHNVTHSFMGCVAHYNHDIVSSYYFKTEKT